MPNPVIQLSDAPEPAPPSGNGILGRIGGEYVAGGSKQLPPAGPGDTGKPREVEMYVPSLGRVRIRYEASQYRHRRSSYWHWRAVWADLVEP